jgi:hypothetical protein
MIHQAYNAGCGDVLHRPYRVIPFRLPGGGTELPQAVRSFFNL